MMKRTLLTLILSAAAAGFASPVRADAPADLAAAQEELKKDAAAQNASLIDAKLASAVASPDCLSPWLYQQARLLQERRRIAAATDKTEPLKRRALNQAAVDIVAEIGRHYLSDDNTVAAKRFDACRAQLAVAAVITDSVGARTIEADIVKAMLADLDGRYLNAAGVTVEGKETAIGICLKNRDSVHDNINRREFVLGVLNRYAPLNTVGAKAAVVERAALRAAGGDVEGADRDFKLVLDDAAAGEDVKNLARYERMRFLAGQAMWKDAGPDAEVLSKSTVSNVSGAIFTPAIAADAKRQALRVVMANGGLDQTGYTAAVDQLCIEVLETENLSAEEKSSTIADALLERSTDAAGRYQWNAALGWAKTAYEIAPNGKVPPVVTLIQQIIANRSRKPLAKDNFSMTRTPGDIDAAAAFYARQSGVKKPAGQAAVTLAANLTNQDQFPRQMADVVSPLSEAFRTAVQRVSAGHADKLTRALALGLLGEPDKAIEAMSEAVNDMGLESVKTAPLINFTARFVRAKFESVALANAFLESQMYGTAGADGKVGTPDDKPNPLTAGKE